MKYDKITRLILFFTALAFMVGCGYKMLGKKGFSEEGLAIPILQNNTTRPGLEGELTKALRQEVLASGRLNLASEDKATLRLNGKIMFYSLTPISFDTADRVGEYRLEIRILFKLENLRDNNKSLWEEELFTRFEYKVSINIVETEKARITALQRAAKELAQKLIPLLLERLT